MSPAVVRLRYRPAADVLSGQVVYPFSVSVDDVIDESPDADTQLSWAPAPDGGEVLADFQIVHASARASLEDVGLPATVARHADGLVDRGSRLLTDDTDVAARIRTRAEVEVQVPVDDLRRAPTDLMAPGHWVVGRTEVQAVGDALDRLAERLYHVPTRGEREAERTLHLARLLREVASVVRTTQGRTTPGTTAAARRACRGGVPLTAGEMRDLRQALVDLDDQHTWKQAAAALDRLSHAVGRQ